MLEEIIKVSILTGIIALDRKQIGNFQISMPIISSPIIAYILSGYSGIYTGFFIGGFFTLLWITFIPIGTTVPPDSTIAGIVATSLSLLLVKFLNIDVKIIMVVSIIVGVSFGFISRWLEVHLREINSYLSDWVEFYSSRGNIAMINLISLLGISLSAFKSFLICFFGIYFGIGLLPRILPTMPSEVMSGIKNTYYMLFCLGFANILYFFITRKFVKEFLIIFLLFFAIFNIFKFSPYKLLIIGLITAIVFSFITNIYKNIYKGVRE